jgi:hypothetical protein
MNDMDLIQQNQIVIMRALALLMPRDGNVPPREMSVSLMVSAAGTQDYLNAKLNKTPFPSNMQEELVEMARAARSKLVEAAYLRAGKEEEPI